MHFYRPLQEKATRSALLDGSNNSNGIVTREESGILSLRDFCSLLSTKDDGVWARGPPPNYLYRLDRVGV